MCFFRCKKCVEIVVMLFFVALFIMIFKLEYL